MGWVKHAFVLSFFCLQMVTADMTYEKGIELALVLAGDTDTNACIAGGMLGAYLGK